MTGTDSTGFFSSARERRLWAGVLLVVLAVYLTLGIAPKLVGLISEDFLALIYVACLILVAVTILTQGLRVRPRGAEVGVALGITVVYTLLAARMAIPERSHLMEYGVLAVVVFEAIQERVNQGRSVPFPAFVAFLITSLFGVLDECIQAILPNRVFDWRDIVFNVLAALVATVAMVLLRLARKRPKTQTEKKPLKP